MDKKITEWLSKTGYPLELYAQKIALSKGYHSEKSTIYADVESGSPREIDLVVCKHDSSERKYSYDVQWIFECKKSDKPLIVLSESETKTSRFNLFLGHEQISNGHPNEGIFVYEALRKLDSTSSTSCIGEFSEYVYSGYSIVQAFSNTDERIYKGVMGLAKAYEDHRSEYHKFINTCVKERYYDKGEQIPLLLIMPVLLVDSPLYYAFLSNSGETEVEETDWASLTVRLPWDNGKMGNERKCNIQIVRKEKLSDFFEAIELFHKYICDNDVLSPVMKYFEIFGSISNSRFKHVYKFLDKLIEK